MYKIIVHWLILAASIGLASYWMPGFKVTSIQTALVAAIILGILNTLVKPILTLLTLPINILSLGLFTLVINGIILALAAAFVEGIHIANFGWAILAALVISIVNTVVTLFMKPFGA